MCVFPFRVGDGSAGRSLLAGRPGRPSLAATAAGIARLRDTPACAARRRRTRPRIRQSGSPALHQANPRTTVICMRRPSRGGRSSISAAHACLLQKQVANLGRPLPRLRCSRDVRPPARPAAAGWLGGLPVLPARSAWPSRADHGSLAHIATLDCAQLRPVLPPPLKSAGFPEAGWLSFFSSTVRQTVALRSSGRCSRAAATARKSGIHPKVAPCRSFQPGGARPYPKVEVTAEPVFDLAYLGASAVAWPRYARGRVGPGVRCR